MRVGLYFSLAAAAACASSPAVAWTPEDITKAIEGLDKATYDALKPECFKETPGTFKHDVKTIDLNNDGVDEIIVTTRTEPDVGCFGTDNRNLDLLVSDGQSGGWTEMLYLYGQRLEISPDPKSKWPLLGIRTSQFDCLAQYRWDHGVYREASFCNQDGDLYKANPGVPAYVDHFNTGAPKVQLAADALPWIGFDEKTQKPILAVAETEPAAVVQPAPETKPTVADNSAPSAPQLPDYMKEIPGTNITINHKASNNTWSDEEVVAAVKGMNVESAKNCADEVGHVVVQTAKLVDMNHDGIDEIEVGTSSEDPQTHGGQMACYGMEAQETSILISDLKGGWHQHFRGMQASGFDAYDTTFSSFPMISPGVGGFCLTLYQWRDDKSQWYLRDACDPVTNRPRFLNAEDEKRGSLVTSYSTGAHAVQPKKLTEAEIKAQLLKSRRPESGLNSLPTYVLDRKEVGEGNASLGDSEVNIDDFQGRIWVTQPKKSMKARGVERGRIIFMADQSWYNSDPHATVVNALVTGLAYSFKKGCKPAPYRVSGGYDEEMSLILKGAAPIWAKTGCAVTGNSSDAPGSVLAFHMFLDE